MPYPSQIDREVIVETARQMIEAQGVDNLSLRELAKKLGVKAPSLYRYVKNKTALLRAVNELTTRSLIKSLIDAADKRSTAREQLLQIAHAFRQFVHQNPACYMLSANTLPDDTRPDAAEREQLALPLQALTAEYVGDAQSLIALRGIYAFIHGWVILEVTQQFERGGDLDAHYEQAFTAFLSGW